MAPLDTDALRREILADLEALRDIERLAVLGNRARRTERLFWTGLLLDIAEVAMPYTLAGRIGMRLIRRVAAREKRIHLP